MTEQKGGINGKHFAVIKDCKSCRFLDEYFGDCCHPDGGGAKDPQPSMDNCLEEHDWNWWREKRNPVKDFIDNIDDGIDLDQEGG